MNVCFRIVSAWARRSRNVLFFGLIAVAASSPVLAGSAAYSYDTLGRLTRVTYSSGVVVNYVYDAAGNRSSYVVTGAPS